MAFLNDAEKEKIRSTITEAETSTSGEIVTVIAKNSDHYTYIPALWAALLALTVPGFNFLFSSPMSEVLTYQVQVLVFLICSLVFRLDAVKMYLIPTVVKQQRASRAAREQFVRQGLHTTKDRTGILIFVSVAEHYVEIIADKGINDKIDENYWRTAIDEFSQLLKQGKTCDGFLAAIAQCHKELATHFPAKDSNPNELPNHLIELNSAYD